MKKNRYSLEWLSLMLCLQLIMCSGLVHGSVTIAGIPDGKGSVNSVGGFTYEIPVKVAPGVNGLTPQISFNYNSQLSAKASPVGYGWNLSGLSEIHRCGQIMAFDSHRDGVKYNDNSDRLCKDGIPLVASDNSYWDASYYHSSQEDWRKIVPIGQCYYGPCYFVVYTKDNRTLEFGSDESSRSLSLGQSGVGRWLLSKVTDANDNEIRFNYLSDGQVRYISRIEYGHGVSSNNSSNSAQQVISFQYSKKSGQNQIKGFYSNGDSAVHLFIENNLTPSRPPSMAKYLKNTISRIKIVTAMNACC